MHRDAAIAAVRGLVGRLMDMGPGRIAWVVLLNALAGLAEGVGVFTLAPLLRFMGVGDGGGAPGPLWLALALFGYVLLVGVAAALRRARSLTQASLGLDLADRLRADLHAAVLAMEWRGFRGLRSADLQQVMTGEIGRVSAAVMYLANLTGGLLTIPFLLAAALALSPALALAAAAAGGAAAVATRALGARGYAIGREWSERARAAMADIADDLAGLRVIKSFGAEADRRDRLARRFEGVRRKQLEYSRLQADERAVLQGAAAAAAAGVVFVAMAVLREPLADTLVLVLAFGRLLQAGLSSLQNWRLLSGTVAALATVDEALARCRAGVEPADAGQPRPTLRRAFSLHDVRVSYDGAAAPALDGVSADIPARRITALIGPSGAGKSTLADLVAGLLAPDAGTLAVDGAPLRPEARRAWRAAVAVVPQDPFLFHDTIRANLRLGAPDADDAALWGGLEAAAAGFVRTLPDGLDTVVGDRGVRLSGGERQRIVLARALLRDPALLVLDEATASLDGETETALIRTIERLRERATVLVIAHRLSTVRQADHVILLEAGRVVAGGAWAELRQHAPARLATLDMLEAGDAGPLSIE